MGLSTTIKHATDKLGRQPKPNSLLPRLRSEVPHSRKRRKSSLTGVVGQGRYRVDNAIGAGAAGVVYAAWHTQLKKPIALKVLRDELCRDRDLVERFLNEARTASAIDDAHVVDVMDCGLLDDGRPYFVMERLEGISLAELLDREGHLDMETSLSIASQVAQGLVAAHELGVIHRDLKPDNIFVCRKAQPPYFIKLLDFGIAKLLDSNEELTRAGHIFGTPHYMSPEQTLGGPIDQRSDIYAFGVVLYELLSGQVPIDGSHPVEVLQRHRDGQFAPLRSHASCAGVPSRLEAIVHRCLEKHAERRYATIQEALDDLRRVWERLEEAQGALGSDAGPVSARYRRRQALTGASTPDFRRVGHAALVTPRPSFANVARAPSGSSEPRELSGSAGYLTPTEPGVHHEATGTRPDAQGAAGAQPQRVEQPVGAGALPSVPNLWRERAATTGPTPSAFGAAQPSAEPAAHRHAPTRDSYRVRARQRLRYYIAAVCLGTLGGVAAAVAVRVVVWIH